MEDLPIGSEITLKLSKPKDVTIASLAVRSASTSNAVKMSEKIKKMFNSKE